MSQPSSVGGPAGVNKVSTMFKLTLQYGKLKINVAVSVTAIASILILLL
jgi:hypothetical protein